MTSNLSPARRVFRIVALGAIALLLVLIVRGSLVNRARGNFHSYLNQPPPEIIPGGTWLNTDEPLRLAELRGKVVWLDFSFLE